MLWAYYIQSSSNAISFIDSYESSKDEIEQIESEASRSAPRWEKAVELFNSRFIDMPFVLTIPNQAQVVLGRQKATLCFIFKDDPDNVERSRDSIRTSLSQGERRALYLLNFVFDVEDRRMNNQETIFILDDIADSFDYKNKHAIIQYLRDLAQVDHFHQIILTHNFDFFRAISQGNGGFVHRARCLMTNKGNNEISLPVAEGVSNYFVNKWKPQIMNCKRVLYSTIPFTRNLIEYTTTDHSANPNYKRLTSLLHWKVDTDQITVGEYISIYNQVFNTNHDATSQEKAIDILYAEAQSICSQASHAGLNLEDKVILSIASRMKGEKFLTDKLRTQKSDPGYWYPGTSDQFRGLIDEYKPIATNAGDVLTLEKVGVTVNSNIHLNSFMYEPILDLTIEHLIDLYIEVVSLNV